MKDCRSRYLVFRGVDNEIIAHVNAYLIETSLVMFSKGIIRRLVEGVRKAFPRFLRPMILECGCPLGASNAISVRRGQSIAEVAAILPRYLDDLARAEGINLIVIRDFTEEEVGEVGVLARYGYCIAPNLPNMTLSVESQNTPDFLASMRSRYRQKVKRGLAIAARANLSTRIKNIADISTETLAAQRQAVFENAREYSREELLPHFYQALSRLFPERCYIVEVIRTGTLVAHALFIVDGQALHWLSFGRVDGTTRDGAYFLSIMRIIEYAIDGKYSRIDMGMTTHSPKTDFGAIMQPLFMFIRYRIRGLAFFMPIALRSLNKVPSSRSRPVFK